ncbi:MAG: hypothetical protein GX606_05815 [Elusimicrobia bacterium]|nr:hypothetical protein [Elusimicrobiota bacterium]
MEKEKCPLITPKTIENTILYDEFSWLWFRVFLLDAWMRADLTRVSQDIGKDYNRLDALSRTQALLLTGVIASGLGLSAAKDGTVGIICSVLLLGGAVGCAVLAHLRHRALARLGGNVIASGTISLKENETLYQLSERLSRDLGIPSMVDIISERDRINRIGFFVAWGGSIFILFKGVIFSLTALGLGVLSIKLFSEMQTLRRASRKGLRPTRRKTI